MTCRHRLLIFVMYISAALLQSISLFPSHVRMLMFLPALNLKLSVAPSAPIIANYLLQPQAMCWLASSNQTLLFSRQGCVEHQKWHFNSLNIPSCHCIWVNAMALCQVLIRFCQTALTQSSDTASSLVCVHHICVCASRRLNYIRGTYYTAFL